MAEMTATFEPTPEVRELLEGKPAEYIVVNPVAIEPEPERAARMEYDEVHCNYVCTSCGERTPTGVFEAVADDDRLLLKPMRYCPACGARLVD